MVLSIICVDCSIYFHGDSRVVILLLVRTSMLLYGVSADLHDEYFSIILMLISSHYMANYGSDPIWSVPGCSVTIIATIMVSHVVFRFTNLMVCVRIFLLAWVRNLECSESYFASKNTFKASIDMLKTRGLFLDVFLNPWLYWVKRRRDSSETQTFISL